MGQMHAPATFVAVDGHDDLGIDGRMVGRVFQDEEVGTQLRDWHNISIDAEMRLEVG